MAKAPEAFRTISEASEELGVPPHVLRFWETRFSFVRPMKRAGGRRFYRRQDLDVLRGLRVLLHEEGYTIKGVQRLHREQGVARVAGAAAAASSDAPGSAEPVDLASAEPAPPGTGEIEAPAPALGPGARARLERVLADLERARSAIGRVLDGES